MTTITIGLSIGMLLFLVAAGLTLIFGMLGIINFAHGSLYALGAYLTWQVTAITGSFWLALIIVPLIVGLIGGAVELGLLRPLYDRDHVMQLLMTFGLILVLDECMRSIWGLDYKNVAAPAVISGSTEIMGSQVGNYRIFVIAFGVFVAASLFAWIEYSSMGMILRAAVSNTTMARCLGIRVARVRTAVFAGGAALAALGGAIATPLGPTYPGMGFSVIIDSFMVIILGGLGNIHGAVAGALLVGMTRAIGLYWAPGWVDILTYSIFLVVILFRPKGLFNLNTDRAG